MIIRASLIGLSITIGPKVIDKVARLSWMSDNDPRGEMPHGEESA